jgi:hypothetical protein
VPPEGGTVAGVVAPSAAAEGKELAPGTDPESTRFPDGPSTIIRELIPVNAFPFTSVIKASVIIGSVPSGRITQFTVLLIRMAS